jgi:ABC-2 type transport system permease protein
LPEKKMPVIRKLFAIVWNDVRIEFSSRWTLVFFLVLPLVFTTIVALAMGNLYGESNPSADSRIPVLVVDLDHSDLSVRLVAALASSGTIRPLSQSQAEAQTAFDQGQAPALLTILPGFGQALLAGQAVGLPLREAANDSRVVAVEQALDAAVGRVSGAVAAAQTSLAEREKIRPFAGQAARQAYFRQALSLAQNLVASPPVREETTQAPGVAQETATGTQQSSSGQLVTWVLITLLGAAEVFVAERLGGTLRRLVVTPTPKATILSGKVVGRLGMGLLQMALLIGFGALVFGVDWGRSPAALALVVVTFGLAAVAFGVMLGTFARTRGQASGLTVLFSMLLAALGGAWWPLEVTLPIYQTVVKALPTTWAMIGFNDVLVRGQGVAGVLPETGILLSFALLFFAVGIWRFRYE